MIKIEELKLLSRYELLQASYDDELGKVMVNKEKCRNPEPFLIIISEIKKDKENLYNQVMSMIKVLNKCSDLTKRLIDLHSIQGLEGKEVAAALHVSERTVYRYIKAATNEFERKQLVDIVEQKPYEIQIKGLMF